MNKTRNNLAEDTRRKVVGILNARLADATDLRSQLKEAHWNFKGAQFFALHELFDAIAGRIDGHIDDIAERAVQLGGNASGTIRQAAAASTLPEPPASPEWVEWVAGGLAAHGALVRAAIDETAGLGDADTADLFTGISRDLDKDLWFVEAHLA
ncbi:MAG: DNA starvation/stationary phase protection protein Dps [Acidobacteria bacterium]|nr:DNA starvation/stationary phase protection protein Dps [Acidobacteriota bacterium]